MILSINPLIIMVIAIVLIFIICFVIGFFGDRYLSKKQEKESVSGSDNSKLINSNQTNLSSSNQSGDFNVSNQKNDIEQSSMQVMQQQNMKEEPNIQSSNEMQNFNANSTLVNQPEVQTQPTVFNTTGVLATQTDPFLTADKQTQPIYNEQPQSELVQPLFSNQQVQTQQNMVNTGVINQNSTFISEPQTRPPVPFDGNIVNDDAINNVF